MMRFRNIIFFIVLLSNMKADDILIKKVIEKTNIEYQKVRDFVEALRTLLQLECLVHSLHVKYLVLHLLQPRS